MNKSDYVICKYCDHFEPESDVRGKCHLYHNWSQTGGGDASFDHYTSPNGRCSHFTLDAVDVVAKMSGINTRPKDGSLIVNLSD